MTVFLSPSLCTSAFTYLNMPVAPGSFLKTVSSDLLSSLFHLSIFQTANRWTAECHVDAGSQSEMKSYKSMCNTKSLILSASTERKKWFVFRLPDYTYILITVFCLWRRGVYEAKAYKVIDITLAICSVKYVYI